MCTDHLHEGWQGSHSKEKKGIHICTKERQSWSKQEEVGY
jgi:hypothetical protein